MAATGVVAAGPGREPTFVLDENAHVIHVNVHKLLCTRGRQVNHHSAAILGFCLARGVGVARVRYVRLNCGCSDLYSCVAIEAYERRQVGGKRHSMYAPRGRGPRVRSSRWAHGP